MSNRHPVHAKLKALPLFGGFTDDELGRLLDLADPTMQSEGDVLLAQGDDGDAMFLLADGEARVVLRSEDGTESEMERLAAGDFFGELALVDHGARSADVLASSQSVTLKITAATLHMFAAESPSAGFKLAMAVLGVVAGRLRCANERYRQSLSIVSAISANLTVMQPAELQRAAA
jgi:CRP/FNR family cyclic AMP-dependent transcriptional regulator